MFPSSLGKCERGTERKGAGKRERERVGERERERERDAGGRGKVMDSEKDTD